jgi:hypothetical protein
MATPAFPTGLLDWADSTGRRVRTTESRLIDNLVNWVPVWRWPRELTAYYPLKRVSTQQEFIFNGKKQVQHRVAA